jgi:DNA-binding CsgD family transcriptional regulator
MQICEGLKAHPAELTAPEHPLRDTGIPVLGGMPWGAHICMFYETKVDLVDSSVSYFQAGFRNNELCVWAVSDPVTRDDAFEALRRDIPDFDRYLGQGQMEIVEGREWYLGDRFDMRRIIAGWTSKMHKGLSRGHEGLRISGNAFWVHSKYWKEFCNYEHELDGSLAGNNLLVLCTYPLNTCRASDVLDAARAHQYSIARRDGSWELLETPASKQVKREIVNDLLDILSRPLPGRRSLTPRERVVLAHIIRGASTKEAARSLGIAPRTVEFHRANILKKRGAKTVIEILGGILNHL